MFAGGCEGGRLRTELILLVVFRGVSYFSSQHQDQLQKTNFQKKKKQFLLFLFGPLFVCHMRSSKSFSLSGTNLLTTVCKRRLCIYTLYHARQKNLISVPEGGLLHLLHLPLSRHCNGSQEHLFLKSLLILFKHQSRVRRLFSKCGIELLVYFRPMLVPGGTENFLLVRCFLITSNHP